MSVKVIAWTLNGIGILIIVGGVVLALQIAFQAIYTFQSILQILGSSYASQLVQGLLSSAGAGIIPAICIGSGVFIGIPLILFRISSSLHSGTKSAQWIMIILSVLFLFVQPIGPVVGIVFLYILYSQRDWFQMRQLKT